MSDKLGPYTDIGAGPWIVVTGGLMVMVGGVLTVRWAARLSAAHVAADEGDDVDEPTDDGMPAGPEPSLD